MAEMMWAGRSSQGVDSRVNAFNSSIAFDGRMYKQDIQGSIAHATMLGEQGIITMSDSLELIGGLKEILADIESGKLQFDMTAEDIHMFIEAELTKRLGDVGKRLHTSRSRNDQVALDIRLYLRDAIKELRELVVSLVKVLCSIADENTETIMPGYTHLQRAQPITFGHHMMAYAQMLLRDIERFDDTLRRMNVSPLGSCALAGTTYHINRDRTAELLGMEAPMVNSLDGVSDRDFCIELASAISICMMHLSRFSEEIIMWCSWEFKFIELSDRFSTGSSIMPQKKNPDVTELIRGKTARVIGDNMTLLAMMKGLPLAYNKDMQEDKEAFFDARDTLVKGLTVFTAMLRTVTFRKDVMEKGASGGFTNATDCADYLVKRGVPFRDAHAVVGRLVAHCLNENKALLDLSLEELKQFHPAFEADVFDDLSMLSCVEKRRIPGAPAPDMVQAAIDEGRKSLEENA